MLTLWHTHKNTNPTVDNGACCMCSKNLTKGFTMIELMIGLVIMGIVMALGLPSYRTWIENTQLRNTAESIVNGLQRARQESVHRNAPVQLVITGTAWALGCVTATANCPASIESKASKEGASASIAVTSDNGTTLAFDAFGRRQTPAAAAGLLTLSIDSTTLDAADSRNLNITVDTVGTVRMCDPNVTATSDPRHC